MADYRIEYRPFTADDFSEEPNCFKNEFPGEQTTLFRHDNCGMILMENDRPNYYFHNLNWDSSRWSGIIRLGSSPLSLQEGVSLATTSQNDPLNPYHLILDSPVAYEVSTKSGIDMSFLYSEKGCIWKEGKDGAILNVNGEWFPYGLICHIGSEYNIPFMHLPVYVKGTYLGKPVEFLACIDRIFAPKGSEKKIMFNATSYISSYCSGIREDGRREWFIGLICHNNGHGLGVYWLEGEPPVIDDAVVNRGVWERLPYVDDGTVVCVNNLWEFGGREFHVIGKWGAKGFTKEPRFDRHGQSQMFGIWYEGKVPYRHKIWNTFNENMEAYADSMKQRGFTVKN